MLKGNKKLPPPGIEHGFPRPQNNQRWGGGLGVGEQPLKLRSAFGIADLNADLQSEFLDLGRHETCRPTFKTFSAFFAE